MSETTYHKAWDKWSAWANRIFAAVGNNSGLPDVCRTAFEAGWLMAKEDERRKPDPLGEALNSGDGSYRP